MASTWTQAAKVRRAFKAGRRRQKDRVLRPIAAIYEACILLDDLGQAMHDAELSPDDVGAALILMTPEAANMENIVYTLRLPKPAELPRLFAEVEKIEKLGKVLPLGIAVWQRDREATDPKNEGVVWVQPFLTGERAARALTLAKSRFVNGDGGEDRFN